MITLKFRCPECASDDAEEIMVGVTQSTSFRKLCVDDDDFAELLYLDSSNECGEVDRYQCMRCGYRIPCSGDPHSLRTWLETLEINSRLLIIDAMDPHKRREIQVPILK